MIIIHILILSLFDSVSQLQWLQFTDRKRMNIEFKPLNRLEVERDSVLTSHIQHYFICVCLYLKRHLFFCTRIWTFFSHLSSQVDRICFLRLTKSISLSPFFWVVMSRVYFWSCGSERRNSGYPWKWKRGLTFTGNFFMSLSGFTQKWTFLVAEHKR